VGTHTHTRRHTLSATARTHTPRRTGDRTARRDTTGHTPRRAAARCRCGLTGHGSARVRSVLTASYVNSINLEFTYIK
jgi:hypothetical protein